jgi:hypothetical protein
MDRVLKTKQDVLDMYRDMVDGKGDEMDFRVVREKKEHGRTISAEALQELEMTVNAFIQARIEHHWAKKPNGRADVGPTIIKAEVRITVDGVHVEPDPDQRPWYVIDGSRRLDV